MKDIDDSLLSAYVDNELSVTEVKKVEGELSSEVVNQLVQERNFEDRISARLKESPCCSDELWSKLTGEMAAQGSSAVEKKSGSLYWYSAALAVAAALLLFFGGLFDKTPLWVPQTVAELTQRSEVSLERAAVNRFIRDKGVLLKLKDYPREHHGKPLSLVGAGMETIAGDEVVALYFDCCGQPAKVFLLPKNSNADKYLTTEKEKWQSGIVQNSDLGDYRVTLVSQHSAGDLLNFISDDVI